MAIATYPDESLAQSITLAFADGTTLKIPAVDVYGHMNDSIRTAAKQFGTFSKES